MSESCFIIPCVKNAKNEDVPSRLFEDLWKISGNYNWAEQQYKIATDEGFLSSVDDIDVVFDKNGQIDAHSFLDITGITFTSDEIKERLSKKWDDDHLPAEAVPAKVSKFNEEEELKDDFVPVINYEKGDTVQFTISQRTPNRSAALQTYLENNRVIRIITDRLKQLGVAYDFVGKEKYNGRFSTENAQKSFDGLYHLISISKGGNIEEVLVEESAHLATLACKDSVFINRLLSLINKDTINSLFTQDEIEKADLNSEEGRLELAGQLVAKAMKNQLEGEYKGFLNRVKQSIYKVFAKTDLKSLLSAKQQARVMAEALAHGFLVGDNLDVKEALKTPATLYSAGMISEEGKLLKGTLKLIKQLGSRVDNFSKIAYRDVYQKLSSKSLLEGNDLVSLSEEETLAITSSAVQSLLDRLRLLAEPLTAITEDIFDKDIDIDVINAIFEATELVKTLKNISEVFEDYADDSPTAEESFVKGISSLIKETTNLIDSVEGNLNNYVKWYSVALIRESIGKDAIDLAADVVSPGIFSPVRRRDEEHISAKKLAISYIDRLSDTSSVITFFRTYSNQRDVTTQIFYDIVRKSKAKEAILYNNEISDLVALEKEWKALISDREVRRRIRHHGFDPDTVLYERDGRGKLTGYFITDVAKGVFERDKREVINAIKKEFKEELDNGTLTLNDGSGPFGMSWYKGLTKGQRYNIFSEYKNNHPYLQSFYDMAYEDRDAKVFSFRYVNTPFINLCKEVPEFKELYDKIIAYKRHIDADYLTDQTSSNTGGLCHGVDGRIPQFKAGFINRIKNKRALEKDLYDTDDFASYCQDVTSDNFGSPITEPVAILSERDDDVEVDKLALYGINLLDNMEDLSTDIFKSLDKYTEMACRFHTSQEVATRLELFNTQLKNRRAEASFKSDSRSEDAARISSQQRRNIMKRFVYKSNKGVENFNNETWLGRTLNKLTNFKAVTGAIAAFGAIRALCISPIAGLKNYAAGLRVFYQDVAAGVVGDNVTLRDAIKQTFLNLKPHHIAGEIARVLYGRGVRWDHYQRLVDRWDSYRTPYKITRRKGFFSLQTLVNILMANYSVTDNALIGIIYYSMLSSHKVYDVAAGKTTTVSHMYDFDKNGNPHIRKTGILKSANEAARYKLLVKAKKELAAFTEENARAEDDISAVIRRVDDSEFIPELEDMYDSLGENLGIRSLSGGYKSIEEIDRVLEEEIRKITFNEDDEYRLCNGINDYIISSQGVYGMLNATEFQSGIYTQSLGKIRGYMFGFIQRNYYSNFSVSSDEYKHAMLDAWRIAFWSIFSHKELVQYDTISGGQYAGYTLALMTIPFATRNKNLMEHMHNCGWDPDQLRRVADMCLGFWINFLLSILCRSLYRGNEKKIGDKVYSAKGRLPLKYAVAGLNLVYPWLGKDKVITPGALAPKRAINIDYAKAESQIANWSNPKRKLRYPKNINDYSYGAFVPGTDEYNDRVQSYYLKNTVYDVQDPLYYIIGGAYRFFRGVRDEGITLMNPVRFVSDLIEMGDYSSSIMFSSGLKSLVDGIKALTANEERREKWIEKDAKFWLSKIGFTYDSTPEPGMSKVQLIDWYGKQEAIDRYRQQQQAFSAGEI